MRTSDEGFPRSFRLLKPDEYGQVFSEGKRSSDRCFLVLARPNKIGHARLGLAISKRNCRRAVDRNRVKRLIRESFRLNQALLTGLDLVVVSRQGVVNAENRQCLSSLAQHWQKMVGLCVA